MAASDDSKCMTEKLCQSEAVVTPALTKLLEPGDRRFMALCWADGLCIYDGWTEYTLDVTPNVFGSCELADVWQAGNAHRGCGRTHILIDFAEGTIYTGDEACVERILDEMVDKQLHHSPLAATFESPAVRLPLDGTRREAF